ncbi:MAG: glycine--tRNA ligase subunit beta [Syntrophaceae bacterium]|nr:glycine--tRNA ligase subunit beta [Syntrophaceae bacterium]
MSKELLFEIGTEEIPAAFLVKAVTDIEELTKKSFTEKRIPFSGIQVMATPRRLCLYIAELGEKQEDQTIEKLGPAKKAAFDEKGNPSKAALGFARGQGLDISQLETVTTEKGEYLASRKTIIGEETAALLPEILTKLVTSIPFRKTMRWADYELRFPRPIHWILALYGGEIISLQLEAVQSSNCSYGHRFLAPNSFTVKNFADYKEKTRENFVIVDPAERKKIILEEARKAADEVGGKIFYTEDLLDTVTFIVEYPVIIRGGFDQEFLQVPKEVLTTTMISHQKYFPVTDAAGLLLPYFIAVSNTKARDLSVIARGNEKVIRARLADARFFFEEDQKVPLETRLDALKKVVFHKLLGTSYDKVMRFRKLAAIIVDKINPAIKDTVDRAALLAKADLETQMVGEFSELQGIMGREYARLAGENPVVSEAIYEHYLPIAAGGDLPQTDEGAIVGIADKVDTITGFFGVGLPPTGTADPYALRRQALGVINIILSRRYALPLDFLIDESLKLLDSALKKPAAEVKKDVRDFFAGRYQNQLIAQGYSYDTVEAVLAGGLNDLVVTSEKIKALQAFRTNPEFEPISIAFKRVDNILKDFSNPKVDAKLFATDAERNLYSAAKEIEKQIVDGIEKNDFNLALKEMARLRPPVDAFFDSVMVMDKDEKVKFNRLSLLSEISATFHKIADFSKIVTAG